jgi:hypothetical protein
MLVDMHGPIVLKTHEAVSTLTYRGLDYNTHGQLWQHASLLQGDQKNHWKLILRRNAIQRKTGKPLNYTWAKQGSWQTYVETLYTPDASQVPLLPTIDDVDIVYLAFGGGQLVAQANANKCPVEKDTPASRFNWHAIAAPKLTGAAAGKLRDGAVYFLRSNITSIPYNAYANGTWAEVTHCGGSKFETFGVWHYGFRGSGLYVNVGQTIAFENHQDASIHFLGRPCKQSEDKWDEARGVFQCDEDIPLFLRAAHEAGWESIQFTHHCDAFCSDNSVQNCGLEIVLTYSAGLDACPVGVTYRTGLHASKPCHCDEGVGMHSYRGACAACAEWVGAALGS